VTTLIQNTGTRGPKPGQWSPRQALQTATEAWANTDSGLPDWVQTLAEACDRTSQGAVAKKIGMSASVVSATIKANYKGTYDGIEARVRGALMAEEVECPVLGPLRKDACLDHQKRAQNFAATSTMRVRMYRACKGGCVHSRLVKTVGGDHAES
jgi:hypothetical protein